MKLQVVGCSHHNASVAVRERLAFSPEQAREAVARLRRLYPASETVLLSTCNRVELYFAAEEAEDCPSHHAVVEFLAEFHGLEPVEVFDELFERTGEDAIRHLFTVAASLDSMVVGEAQILSQVKQAYEMATFQDAAGPLTHAAFQAAIRVAKRVAHETQLHQKRVSIPSVAVADFARQFFERFDDKRVLLIGAGEMGAETLRYLLDEGAQDIVLINRHRARAEELAQQLSGRVEDWQQLPIQLAAADLVVSTTGAAEAIVSAREFQRLHHLRDQQPILILDLAIPRDFDPAIGELPGVYLYCIDDLQQACDRNRLAREREWPRAEAIVEDETARFMTELNHRATGPVIKRLRTQAETIMRDELERLFHKLGPIDNRTDQEIRQAFQRLINKILHPPLESLRDEARRGTPHGLIDALKRLFQMGE